VPAREADAAAIVARALHDPAGAPPAPLGVDAAALIAAASRHRVLLLAGWTLRAAGTLEDWPSAFITAFQQAERQAIVVDGVRHAELVTVLAELSAAGVRVVVFKGAALAHTHYPAPHVRVRADTDLLVAASEVRALEDVLGRLGYVRPAETSGRLVSYQSHYYKIDRHGVTHAFDVHWRISNLQALADRLTFQELWDHRIPLAALGSSAVTIDDVHALLVALVHLAGHHPGSRNLLWVHDLHMLASRLTPEEMRQVQEIAGARGLGPLAADGLALARDWFGQASVDPIIDALRARGPRQDDAMVLQGPWTQARVLRLDLDALPNWRARGRLIREHLLPSTHYMRARYGVRSNLLLPGFYVWRVLCGAPQWLRSHKGDD
jgi:Uncharacterised nucleotidyltransferase